MKSKLHIAMLGCGGVADLYLPAFKYLDRADVVAAIDLDERTAREVADKYNVGKAYGSAAEAARDDAIDAVIVGTPPDVHAEHIELFASRGKHVLCEKPMASTVEDCKRIINACRDGNVVLQMGHMKRFMRGNQKVKAIIDSGALGKIFMAECHWDCAVPQLVGSYREQAVTAGGSLQDHGPHAFDLVRWWTGNDILSVSATIRSVHPERPTEDAAVAVLEHENGMFSYHHMTRISYGREQTQDTYRIYGTEGTLVVRNDHHFPTMSFESPEIILYRPGECVQRFETLHGWNIDDVAIQNFPFYNQVEAFCEAVLDNTPPRVSGEDGKHVIEGVIAAYISSWKGVKVQLPVTETPDLSILFRSVKQHDMESFGRDYTVRTEPQPPLSIPDHVLGHRPPRTKEAWSADENGMHGKAELVGLPRRLRRSYR
jgi:predicted dehydrogenase